MINNLYGDYNQDTKSNFLGLYKTIAPLLVPGTGPLLANSVCIKPLPAQFNAAKGKETSNMRYFQVFDVVL